MVEFQPHRIHALLKIGFRPNIGTTFKELHFALIVSELSTTVGFVVVNMDVPRLHGFAAETSTAVPELTANRHRGDEHPAVMHYLWTRTAVMHILRRMSLSE